jgi:hypothetical protein
MQLPLLSRSAQQLRKFSNSVHFDNFPHFLVSQNWYLCKQWSPSMTIVFVSDLCRIHKQVCRLWSQILHTVHVAINVKYQPLNLWGWLLHEQTPPWSAFLEKTTSICDFTVLFILQIHEVRNWPKFLSEVLNKNWNHGGSLWNFGQHLIDAGLRNKDTLLFIKSSRAMQRYTHWSSSQTT